MGVMPDFEPPPPGCKGKIDFLFLISRLGTMKTEQDKLLPSLPGFIATIEAMFPDFDSHVMVANPDGYWPGWNCKVPELCGTEPYTCDPFAPGFQCGFDTWDIIKPCDEAFGAGILFNVGPDSANEPCVLAEGRRYMALPGEPSPVTAFDCIARVGNGGGNMLGEALVAAVSPALNADDGCNAGFLRPDALLVVTMITDTEDEESKGSPKDWYEAVVTAKGDPGAVVMLAIQPQTLMGEPKPNCTYDGQDHMLRLRDLIRMFPYHEEGDCCAESYVPFFETAVGRVVEACSSFVPQ
jgi:hypothetical protein